MTGEHWCLGQQTWIQGLEPPLPPLGARQLSVKKRVTRRIALIPALSLTYLGKVISLLLSQVPHCKSAGGRRALSTLKFCFSGILHSVQPSSACGGILLLLPSPGRWSQVVFSVNSTEVMLQSLFSAWPGPGEDGATSLLQRRTCKWRAAPAVVFTSPGGFHSPSSAS